MIGIFFLNFMQRFIRHIPPYLPTAMVLAAILYISLAPNPMPDEIPLLLFPGADKIIHFIMYCALTGTFCFDYYRRGLLNSELQTLATALVVSIIIGGVIELLQGYMGIGRSNDWWDFAANTAGCLTGVIIGKYYIKKLL